MLRTAWSLIFTGLFVSACLTAQATRPSTEDRKAKGREFLGLAPTADPVAAARGQKTFTQNCAFCHGPNATGAEGPDLLRSTVVLHDENGELISPVVLKGRPDRGMPAFASFTPEQTQDIAAFLHSRVEAAANRWGYKFQNLVTGDAHEGESFFAQHCTSCHSASGNLAHIAAKFEPADLQAQFLYPSSVNVETTAVVRLTTGEEYKGTIKNLDDFTVSLRDESGDFHAFKRDAVDLQITDPLAGHRELLKIYTNRDMHNVLAYLETLK
jgi:cytochrome c oxidase cbb3-type subunit III